MPSARAALCGLVFTFAIIGATGAQACSVSQPSDQQAPNYDPLLDRSGQYGEPYDSACKPLPEPRPLAAIQYRPGAETGQVGQDWAEILRHAGRAYREGRADRLRAAEGAASQYMAAMRAGAAPADQTSFHSGALIGLRVNLYALTGNPVWLEAAVSEIRPNAGSLWVESAIAYACLLRPERPGLPCSPDARVKDARWKERVFGLRGFVSISPSSSAFDAVAAQISGSRDSWTASPGMFATVAIWKAREAILSPGRTAEDARATLRLVEIARSRQLAPADLNHAAALDIAEAQLRIRLWRLGEREPDGLLQSRAKLAAMAAEPYQPMLVWRARRLVTAIDRRKFTDALYAL
jgi:hypothetical protein